jgi:putative transport protein
MKVFNKIPASVWVVAVVALLAMCCAQADGAGAATPEKPGSAVLVSQMVVLFMVVGLGMLLGKIRIFGVSFGSSGVIFAALGFGAWGFTIPGGVSTLGLVLFVYCIGLAAGPTFFRVFAQHGASMAQQGVVIVMTGLATALAFAWLAGIPTPLAAGVFAGAMTSTPALASALDALKQDPMVSVGYGVAYPCGVVGIVLFVQLVPRLLRVNLDDEARRLGAVAAGRRIVRKAIEVANPSLYGRRIGENAFIATQRCQISRVGEGERFLPVTPETCFAEGQIVLAVGEADQLPALIDYLGRASERRLQMDSEQQRMKVVVTSKEMLGKELGELNLLNRFGVTVTRLERNEVTAVPRVDTEVQYADVLTAIGEAKGIKEFAEFAGHRTRALDETDIISLVAGMALGLVVGMAPIGISDRFTFTLGAAGGPLLVALVLSHFGNLGALRGRVPRAARMLMSEMGLVFFLAGAGVQAGGQFVQVMREYGVILPVMGLFVTTLPLAAGYLFARYRLKLNLLQTLGATCGGRTCTPGLGAIAAKTDSEIPIISYATVYPVALILVTLSAQIIAQVLPRL